MTLKLEGALDILEMYLHTKNKAASSKHLKLCSLKVKGQGQMSANFNHFQRSSCDIFLPSYIDF